MVEELQSLLDRIQKDGVDKAKAQSNQIVTSAQEKADALLKEAKEKAKNLLKKAETDSMAFEKRAKKSLEQASRDILISTETAITASMQTFVADEITKAMDDDTLKTLIIAVVKAYSETGETRIEILLSQEQQKTVTDFFISKYKNHLDKGLEIKPSTDLIAGFKVQITEQNVQHDFTVKAISEAFCRLLRPALIDVMRNAQAKDQPAS
ncbi:MAG: hypothetical protein KAH23_09635 [Kiritimatiellae bacterium]|nr:hypothetical protein [Kiritimatiellia bacterium]